MIATVAPLIAMVAISKSFLGHYLGAQEGMNGLMAKSREKGKNVDVKQLNKVTAVFADPDHLGRGHHQPGASLGMIEDLGGPIIAMLLFLMPMYAIQGAGHAQICRQPKRLLSPHRPHRHVRYHLQADCLMTAFIPVRKPPPGQCCSDKHFLTDYS